MGRQALSSKESELTRSNTISPENTQGIPNIPRYSTSGFQKAAQQTPVLWSGSKFFREASPENIPNLSKMNQNNIELCKTTGFWWVDRPEPLKNQNWQRSLEWTGEILRSYESNNTENIEFDEIKTIKKKTKPARKKQEKTKRKLRILVSCFFLVFLFLLVIFPVDFCFWWFCFFFCFLFYLFC